MVISSISPMALVEPAEAVVADAGMAGGSNRAPASSQTGPGHRLFPLMAGARRDLVEPIVIEQKTNGNSGPHGPFARAISTSGLRRTAAK
jgi:hypothetical protein